MNLLFVAFSNFSSSRYFGLSEDRIDKDDSEGKVANLFCFI